VLFRSAHVNDVHTKLKKVAKMTRSEAKILT